MLPGDLSLPPETQGLVLVAHGSGSSRFNRRDRIVARRLEHVGLGTLLLDLLDESECGRDAVTTEYRFNIDLLATRLVAAIDWVRGRHQLARYPLGLFGASTGAGAALAAAAQRPRDVYAVVSRGGRTDLAGDALPRVVAPTLLIVATHDREVLQLNRAAAERLRSPSAPFLPALQMQNSATQGLLCFQKREQGYPDAEHRQAVQ